VPETRDDDPLELAAVFLAALEPGLGVREVLLPKHLDLPLRGGEVGGLALRNERARQATADTGDADAVPTDAEIVAALRRKAEKGDAAAARELREWRQVEAAALHGDAWMEVLLPEEREAIRAMIAARERAGR
jgi:hypothetical protein